MEKKLDKASTLHLYHLLKDFYSSYNTMEEYNKIVKIEILKKYGLI